MKQSKLLYHYYTIKGCSTQNKEKSFNHIDLLVMNTLWKNLEWDYKHQMVSITYQT